jgi:hypothetical protein
MNNRIKNSHLSRKNDRKAEYKISYYDLLINSRPFRLEKNSSRISSYTSLKEEVNLSNEIQRALEQRSAKKFSNE